MATYVILDTSIYRQLGLRFQENIDFKNFCGFLVATDNELLISDIVVKEFTGYYTKQLNEKINNYSSSIKSLMRDPFFKSGRMNIKDFSKNKVEAIKEFESSIYFDPNHGHHFSRIETIDISTLDIVDFIIESNNKGIKKIQLRDLLIWISVLSFAKKEMYDRVENYGDETITFEACNVAFITDDNGFTENELFVNEKNRLGITNLELYSSIPQFLNKYGYNIPFLTKELLRESIMSEDILIGLKTDSGCFLSYISSRYSPDECHSRKILEFNIEDYEVIEYYSYKDNDENKYVAHLKVYLNVIYESDDNTNDYLNHIKNLRKSNSIYRETYDSRNRPIFNAPILYMLSGELDLKNEKILTKEMIDFIPDRYFYSD